MARAAVVFLATAAAVPALAQTKATATLTVRIEHVSEKRGQIRLAVYERANWAGREGETAAEAVVPAVPGETIVALNGLPPGVYAIKTFQDENKDEKMDFNWLGIPLERFGFSNDAKPFLDQPSFDEAKFEVRPGANETTITLRSLF
jgi:uncharacterized protein (DUF2141 family)